MATQNWQQLDEALIWHPFTQSKTAPENITIVKGEGPWLTAESGDKLFDAICSWWVNIHGHSHPYIAKKIHEQLLELEHVIFAGFTHPPAIEICRRLSTMMPEGINRFFFSDNGSTAVEVGLKMAIQYWHNQGLKKLKILALEDAYHGDTFGAMSAGARSIFFNAFEPFLFEVVHLPRPSQENRASCLQKLKDELLGGQVAAFIYEPLLQGAGGMHIYDAAVFDEMLQLCKDNDVICIADEVMTGFYRTGTFLASNQVPTPPDIVCLSKGLTGGTLPLSLTVCRNEIYEKFSSEDMKKTFFHGHSYTANPVGCAAALASLDLIQQESCQEAIQRISKQQRTFVEAYANHPYIKNMASIGTVVRFELNTGNTSYVNTIKPKVISFAHSKNVLLRPLGNVVYLMPPYCTTADELNWLHDVLRELVAYLEADLEKRVG